VDQLKTQANEFIPSGEAILNIAILGDINLDFLTHRELVAEAERLCVDVDVTWVPTDAVDATQQVIDADGLWLIPGTPYKNDEVAYQAIEHARTSNQPFLGSCGGFQYALVEFARNVAGITHAQHGELSPHSDTQVVSSLSCSLIAQERQIRPVKQTRLAEICGEAAFNGFHFCNYGLSAEYESVLSRSGLVINARADDAGVEGIELPEHRFFIATLFQPQVGAVAKESQHPLITAFASEVLNTNQ